MYVNTIIVRMQAILSASLSVLPAFSPRALAQSLQIFFIKSTTKQGRNENSQTATVKQQISNMGLLLRYYIKHQYYILMPKQDNVSLVVQTKPVVFIE